MIQTIPGVGDVADGVIAADYARKGDYAPALAAIGVGLITPNAAEATYHAVDADDYAAKVIRARRAAEDLARREQEEAAKAVKKVRGRNPNKRAKDIFTEEAMENSSTAVDRGSGNY